MEFKITKEQIEELSRTNAVIKEQLNEYFPEAFKKELEVGKWYVSKFDARYWFMNYQGEGCVSCGFNSQREWSNSYVMQNEDNWRLATYEEVCDALIAEAKKRGYVGKEIVLIQGGLPGAHSETKMSDKFSYEVEQNQLMCECGDCGSFTIFKDGLWATILPPEKIVIAKGKALKILAKKLKVSPENIEIK